MANNLAKSLAKKYLFKEDVYQTDVEFSTNGDKMFVNGADIGKDTTIYEYNTTLAYKSLNATLVTGNNLAGFSHDLSLGVGSVFGAAQSLFDFKHGISDMYQFVLDLSNNAHTYTLPMTDSSAVRLVDNSNNAIQGGNNSIHYKAGVLYFTHNISFGATTGASEAQDSSGGSPDDGSTGNDISNSLFHEVTKAKNMYEEIGAEHDKIIQQFNRIFFKDDGTKMYALYTNKTKAMSYPFAKGVVLQTFDLTTPFSFNGVNSILASNLANHVTIYDVSLMFNTTTHAALNPSRVSNTNIDHTNEKGIAGAEQFKRYSKGNIIGLFDQVVPDEFREIIGFHISNDGKKIFFLSSRGKYSSSSGKGASDDTGDSEVASNNTYFGEVTCFDLATPWSVTSSATKNGNPVLVYGNQLSTTSMNKVGIYPIDINFNYAGTKLHILGSEGKKEYLYTYDLASPYTLPSALSEGSRTEIKDVLVSFSSANSSDGTLKNVHGSGVQRNYAKQIRDASVVKGNTFTLTAAAAATLPSVLRNIITNGKLTNVLEYEKQTPITNKKSYFYNYDPLISTIITDNGEVLISNLKVNQSKITAGGIEFTFIGLVDKKVNEALLHAIVLKPSAAIGLSVVLNGGEARDIIVSQPFTNNEFVKGQIRENSGDVF